MWSHSAQGWSLGVQVLVKECKKYTTNIVKTLHLFYLLFFFVFFFERQIYMHILLCQRDIHAHIIMRMCIYMKIRLSEKFTAIKNVRHQISSELLQTKSPDLVTSMTADSPWRTQNFSFCTSLHLCNNHMNTKGIPLQHVRPFKGSR